MKTSSITNTPYIISKRIKSYIKNYPKRIDYTWQHKKAFVETEKQLYGKNSFRAYFHDTDKLLMYIIGLPKHVAHDIHVATAPHHIRDGKVKSPKMAVVDWECARFTKKDKPLTAREFYEAKCPKIPEIDEELKKVGL